MEKQDHVRSVSFGFWIKSGSAYETAAENGVSHFMEHMAFKGTAEKSARQIAEEMDAIGGQMNAYTAKEYTCYYGRTLTEHLEKAFSILAGMVTRPKLDPGDIQTEKSVIMEEISMTEDMPEDRVVENQYAGVWRKSSYGRPAADRPGRAETGAAEKIFPGPGGGGGVRELLQGAVFGACPPLFRRPAQGPRFGG